MTVADGEGMVTTGEVSLFAGAAKTRDVRLRRSGNDRMMAAMCAADLEKNDCCLRDGGWPLAVQSSYTRPFGQPLIGRPPIEAEEADAFSQAPSCPERTLSRGLPSRQETPS